MSKESSSFSIKGLTMEDAYREIDAEVSRLQDRIRSLYTLRNSLSPISQMPTEILSTVFHHAKEDSIAPVYDDCTTRFILSWVCSHWRQVALATPSLWTVISKRDTELQMELDFVQELLHRSGNQDLAVNIPEPAGEVEAACLSQLPRIQHLQLQYEVSGPNLGNLLSQPAPRLISLYIHDWELDINPFSGNHPNLRCLTISAFLSITIPAFKSALSPTLTDFCLSQPDRSVPVADLVSMLTSLPNLTILRLEGCFGNETVLASPQPLECPMLRTLSISDSQVETVFAFLQHLDIPQAHVILIWPEDEIISNSDAVGISIALNDYREAVPFQIRHLYIRQDPPNDLFNFSSTPSQYRHSFRFPGQELVEGQLDEMFEDVVFDDLETGLLRGYSISCVPPRN